MRAQGRCAGCQESGELAAMVIHLLACEKWAALYRSDPGSALDAAAEYERWREQERPAERQQDLARRVADTQFRRQASEDRFTVRDPLED